MFPADPDYRLRVAHDLIASRLVTRTEAATRPRRIRDRFLAPRSR